MADDYDNGPDAPAVEAYADPTPDAPAETGSPGEGTGSPGEGTGEPIGEPAPAKARRRPAKKAAKRAAEEGPESDAPAARPRRRRRATAAAAEVLPILDPSFEPGTARESAEPEVVDAELLDVDVIDAQVLDIAVVEALVIESGDDAAGPVEGPGPEDVVDAEIVDAIGEAAHDVPLDSDDEGDAEPEASAASDPAPALAPAFGLFFQAPTAPAPRRASRPAGAVSASAGAASTPHTDGAAPSPEPQEASSTDATVESGADDALAADGDARSRSRRRRGGRGRRPRAGDEAAVADASEEEIREDEDDVEPAEDTTAGDGQTARRRRRRRRSGAAGEGDDPPGTVTRVREIRRERDEPQAVKGSTRLEAKKLRRREGREAGRRRTIITEKEFLARRESVERIMVVRRQEGRTQIAVLEDGILVEHYVSRTTNASMAGNVYLGRVQNVLPSMEAAFVDIGRGRNAVLYAGEVNWDAAGLRSGEAKRIENVLTSGESVLVQVTKDPLGHKGARLTSQISLPGRYLVYVPQGSMTGISRKLPDTERNRLKSILREIVPTDAGVIVRTAAEGASEEELRRDVERLARKWERISAASTARSGKKPSAPSLLYAEPDLTVRVIRDVFNEDFASLVVSGDDVWTEISDYIEDVAPDLAPRMTKWTGENDIFAAHRVDEQIVKALERKVFLPSGGSLVIDRTEAMTVVDVNTGKFVGSGGNLEETVTKNNLEAAEEIVRQLRLRDIGGIIVIDFIDMVLESNRDLVVRRLLECLGRDRTKHQVAEVTSLGLVQMTRKRVASGLLEVFSEICDHCDGRGVIVRSHPVDKAVDGGSGAFDTSLPGSGSSAPAGSSGSDGGGRSRRGRGGSAESSASWRVESPAPSRGGPTAAQIAAAAHAAAVKSQNRQELPTPDGTDEITATVAEGGPGSVEAIVEAAVEPAAEVADVVAAGEPAEGVEGGAQVLDHDVAAPVHDHGSPEQAGHDDGRPEPGGHDDGDDAAGGEFAADGQEGDDDDSHATEPPSRGRQGGRPRRRRGRATSPAGPPRPVGT